jgi:hypothetical protein
MSDKDNHPAQGDDARPIYPVTFFGDGDTEDMRDFTPKVLPASAVEDEAPPKAESVPAPAVSSELMNNSEETDPVPPAPAPAAKVTGPPRGTKAGSPTS